MPDYLRILPSTTTQAGAIDKSMLSPEMVNTIADLVYGFLMEELKIERERARLSSQSENSGGC